MIQPHALAFGLVRHRWKSPGSSSSVTSASWIALEWRPIEQRHDRLEVEVGPHLAPLLAPLDEVEGAVRILAHQESVDLALELEVGAVVPDEHDAIRHPVLLDEVLGAVEPVSDDREESGSRTSSGASSHAGSDATARL